ncbi:archaetidylserine decarboxylase [Gilliamella sp. wkB308]|uniref:archaetidylserine decarboxylase n=1 Tax=Gilliamella sp. wkB308 TaxID=3120263 RepID=UPI00080DB24C|nr:archaetidylserine decarboxylase [Gilliamella apicola]OCF95901.1 phosphatidylserine decarboxylase [Gilliamella apicola]
MLNQLKAIIQYLLPKQFLTIIFGWLAKKQLGKVTTWMIKGFCKLYRVDLSEAKLTNAADYKTFNDFFARKLKEDAREIDTADNSIIMPADGVLSQFGTIQDSQLLQAKGHFYSLESLVACHPDMIKYFQNGSYATTYLSPKNYHRFHMPCDGTLREMIYVPGSLFSVSKATTESIPNIFARNERVICLFETELGPMAQILVGATIVGSIEVDWAGIITPPREGIMKRWTYSDEIKLSKGQDMGCFKLGSTVITLFASNAIEFSNDLKVGDITRVGQKLAERI